MKTIVNAKSVSQFQLTGLILNVNINSVYNVWENQSNLIDVRIRIKSHVFKRDVINTLQTNISH